MKTYRMQDIGVGKFVGGYLYLHVSALTYLPSEWQQRIVKATALTALSFEKDFNVVKLRGDTDELSLLDYAEFFNDPFPALKRSWRVQLTPELITYRSYLESRNPPILHRKELLLPVDHPRIDEYRALTEAAETLGLFSDVKKIGFREYWYAVLANAGYKVTGGQLVPIANVQDSDEQDATNTKDIRRYATALSRSNFSAPVQALLRHGLISQQTSFFDYGCGRGDDVRGLQANGITASGWDPHYAAHESKKTAHVVNLGFVVNVIEDPTERVAALKGAFSLTRGVLSVAAMLTSQIPPDGKPYRDGYLSSRNTFQKYFSQAQLKDFIEHALDHSAIAVAPGVFFVFRDKDLEQQFLVARYGRKPHTLGTGLTYIKPERLTHVSRLSVQPRTKTDRAPQLFKAYLNSFTYLWEKCLELGRIPEREEIDASVMQQLENAIGSYPKAVKMTLGRFDQLDLAQAREACISDLIVFGALQQFEKRTPYRKLEPRLQIDIRRFFGDYSAWQETARSILFSIRNIDAIDAACRSAAEKGYGYLIDSESLQLHASLLERLPTLLRIYVACATILCGDISEFDLIKIHIRSGKVTLMKFDDFDNVPLPRLKQRIKVNLRAQDLDVFEYGKEHPPTLLYHKSRYVNEEFPHIAEQLEFESALNRLALYELDGFGPPEKKFYEQLEAARWQIDGFKLSRSRRIPALDTPCGKYLTYRQLIECGEAQHRTRISNLPAEPDSYTALYELAIQVLDPIIEYYGMVKLTFGFCSPELARKISRRIAPALDQHAAHEKKKSGKYICERLGASCDFIIEDEDMEEVSRWVFDNTNVDRVYYYGPNRPIHVSYSADPARQLIHMVGTKTGKMVPRVVKISPHE